MHGPAPLVGQARVHGLRAIPAGQAVPQQRRGGAARLPQVLHGQQVADVISKQLGEQLHGIVVGLSCPGARALAFNVS